MGLVFADVWKDTAERIEKWITFPVPFGVLEIPIEMAMKAVAYPFCLLIITVGNGLETFLNTININVAKVAPAAIKGLKDFIKDPAGTIVKGFASIITGVQDFISDEKGPLKTWIDGAGSWVWGRITDVKIGFPSMLSGFKVDLFGFLNPAFDAVPKTISAFFEPKLAEGLEALNVVLERELGTHRETT